MLQNFLPLLTVFALFFGFIWLALRRQKEKNIRLEQQRIAMIQAIEDAEVAEVMRVVDESINIVNTTKNNGTKISRCDVVVDKLSYLTRQYPHREDIEKSLNDTVDYRCHLHDSIVEEQVDKFLTKSKLAKTLTGKLNNANKALEVLKEATTNKYVDQKKVVASVAFVKDYMHHAELQDIKTKAERFEFKENYKKALSYYQDVLFFLRKDDIEDSLQTKEIKRLEQKIKEMKRKISTRKLK